MMLETPLHCLPSDLIYMKRNKLSFFVYPTVIHAPSFVCCFVSHSQAQFEIKHEEVKTADGSVE